MGMNRRDKASVDVIVNILSNVAVVGIGLALYEQKWWCFTVAAVATIMALVLARSGEK